jgi:hypothetical protein
MLVSIQIACSIYKLTHKTDFLHCNEMFAIWKSIMHLVFNKFVFSTNLVFWNQIRTPKEDELAQVMDGFMNFVVMTIALSL